MNLIIDILDYQIFLRLLSGSAFPKIRFKAFFSEIECVACNPCNALFI